MGNGRSERSRSIPGCARPSLRNAIASQQKSQSAAPAEARPRQGRPGRGSRFATTAPRGDDQGNYRQVSGAKVNLTWRGLPFDSLAPITVARVIALRVKPCDNGTQKKRASSKGQQGGCCRVRAQCRRRGRPNNSTCTVLRLNPARLPAISKCTC